MRVYILAMRNFFRPSILLIMLLAFLVGLGGFMGVADAESKTKHKKKPTAQHRQAPRPANAYILMDADTGMVISQYDADRTLYPASLTKLMTLLLTFEALDNGKITSNSSVVMTSHAASMPPSKLGIKPGQSITVNQAIKALVTKSANDVATALGERIGGSESRFAQIMNLKARELGMTQTRFVNPSGLHNVRQTSSPRDMAKLAMHIIKNYPHHYYVFSTQNFNFKGKNYHNHNRLMASYRGMDGMKTGYISQSGFNLVASAKRGNVRLLGVVFGGTTANSRNAQMANLLDDGFARVQQLRLMRPQVADAGNSGAILKTHRSTPTPLPPKKPDNLENKVAANTTAFPPARPAAQTLGTIPTPILKPTPFSPSPTAYIAPESQPQTTNNMSWSIQIGAFQDRVSTDQALYKALQKLPSPLNRGNAIIVPLRTAEATWMFRARIAGYTREQALQACRYLDDCLTISPSAN